uniref:Uncharacterized protein n=1 Tax=Panagrellus redivivus TaxID=6233 RepID=A0A7E4VJE0_PANRE
MNLLSVHQNSASRPSLFSSLWSIQVQQPNEVNEIPYGDSKSQQSLFARTNVDEGLPGTRNAISLNELALASGPKLSLPRSSTCPAFSFGDASFSKMPYVSSRLPVYQQRYTNFNRQQKNINICEWLQKISGVDPLSETNSIASMTSTPSEKHAKSM